MFSALKVRNFRIYWFGALISLSGTWIQAVALSWLVFRLTNSSLMLGVVGFLTYIPISMLSLFGGVLADRANKRNILIATQICFMALAFLLAILTQFELISPFQIMLIALLNGVVMAFDAPSRQAVVVELVGRENLFNAIALNSIAFNASRIIGPALAGILIATIGMSGCFYLNGVSFLALIAALLLINVSHFKPGVRNKKAKADLKEGIRFIKDNRLIMILIIWVAVVSLFGISYVILMPVFAYEVLNVGVGGLGTLMSGVGIGAVFGALILARMGETRKKGTLLLSSSLVFSLSLILFSISRTYIFSIIALGFIGASSVTAVALINTLLQMNVPDEFRGRVMSVFMLTFAGMMPFGNLIAGGISQIAGAPFAVMLGGLFCLAFFLAAGALYSGLRKL